MPIVVPVLASQVVFTDLAAPMLAEPVSQQSVAAAAWCLMRQADAGAATVSVLSVIMTKIVSNLASLLQGVWHPTSHTSQSALYPLLTDDMFLLNLLQQELVLLLAPDLATFLTVFSLLVQHCQQ